MRSSRSGLALLLLLVTLPATAQAEGNLRYLRIASTALAGNLLGEPAEQEVAVYVPPGYDASGDRRYPVLYLLHGIGGGFTDWTGDWNVQGTMDALVRSGQPPFLIVMPNGGNRLGGGFYLDSPVSGNW